MKNILTVFFALVLLFCFFSSSAVAQDGQDNDKIWSLVRFEPSGSGNIDPNYKWEERTYEPRFLFGAEATVEPNFRPWPGSNTTQSELSVDVHPLDENIIFASANATPWPVTGIWGTGVYWSLDGASNWVGFDNPPFGTNSGDPASVIGVNGNFYENYISNPGGQGIAVSTNSGTSWTTHTVAPNPGSLADKNHMMVDKTGSSPYVNRLYVSWTDFGGANNNDVVIRYSTNVGSSWSSSINLGGSLSAGSHTQGVNVQTASNGDVYAAFAVYDGWPGGEDAIGFSKSTDGGATWSSARIYSAVNFGIRGNLKPTSIRVSSFPVMAVDRSGGANDGTIYICWPQINVAPAGSDPDIVVIKSTDGGTTWSSPVRVNDDPLSNGKDQYYPWITVDQTSGQVMLVFYDSRETTNDSTGVWMATSVNGGSTWDNFRVSDENFRPKPIGGLAGGYQGDYIGIAAHNDVAYPYWADDRTGNYQGWMSVVSFGPPCPVDPATNPTPANGTTDVSINLNQISWTNGAGATENELWFGEAGNMLLVHSGSLASSYIIPAPLTYSTVYQWRVIEQNDTCGVNGPVWSFTTEADPNIVIDTIFFDDFESGIGQWTVTNDGGTCVWEIFLPAYPNSYTLPGTSSGGVLAADSDECGSGTTMLTTATIVPILDLSTYTDAVWIEFDNDWNVIDAQDEAHVEVSTDGGSTWTGVWDQIGTDIRNTHEVLDVTGLLGGQSNVSIRVRSVQPGWDWWWALDNFMVWGQYIVPVELTSFTASVNKTNVNLNWVTATETNNQGFEVQRKVEDGEFNNLGFVGGFGTTTETKSYSFIDIDVEAGSYTYRLKQLDLNGSYEYSPEVEVDVTTPIEYALEQNYPNPFNPSTVIKYSIPQDGMVTLYVFNLLGEKVATLVNGVMQAGRYEVNFDASKLASGIYVYTINSGSFNSVKKMVLMK